MKTSITTRNVQKALFLGIAIIFLQSVFGQNYFNESIDLIDRDVALNMQHTPVDNGQITTGYTIDLLGNSHINLVKTDMFGGVVWNKIYNLGANDRGNAVEATSDGGYIVTGCITVPGGFQDLVLLKTDALGNIVWVQTYPHATPISFQSSTGYSVEELIGGGYIVCGETFDFISGLTEITAIFTDPLGNLLAQNTYPNGANNSAKSIKPYPGGGYVLTGYTDLGILGTRDLLVARLDPLLNVIWMNQYGGPGTEEGNSIEVLPGGNLIIAGESDSYSNGNRDIFLVNVEPVAGGIIWASIYGRQLDEVAHSVEFIAPGNLAVTGWTNSIPGGASKVAFLMQTSLGGFYLGNRVFGSLTEDQIGYSVKQDLASQDLIIGGVWNALPASGVVTDEEIYMVRTDLPMDSACPYKRNFLSLYVFPWTNPVLHFNFPNAFMNPMFGTCFSVPPIITDQCCDCSAIVSSFVPSATTACAGTVVNFTNTSTCAIAYRWRVNGTLLSTATNFTYTFPGPGLYTITLEARVPGCPPAFSSFTYNVTCRQGDFDREDMINVYPNPASDKVTVEAISAGFGDEATLQIVDLAGRTVIEHQLSVDTGATATQVDLSDLSAGIYTVVISSGDGILKEKLSVVK